MRLTGEAQARVWMVSQGAQPMQALLSESVDLAEDLKGTKIMRDWSPEGVQNNRHILYHPDKGMLGVVTLEPKDHRDINQATRASMTISTFHNPDAKDDIRPSTQTSSGRTTHGSTGMGPSYNLGPSELRRLLRSFREIHPNLKRIDSSTRVTGVKTDHEAQFNLERGAGPLRGVRAAQRLDRPNVAAPARSSRSSEPGLDTAQAHQQVLDRHHRPSSPPEHYRDVLMHHGYEDISGVVRRLPRVSFGSSHYRHPSHPSHEVVLIHGDHEASSGWSHNNQDGRSVQSGHNSDALDRHLTYFHNSDSSDPVVHQRFYVQNPGAHLERTPSTGGGGARSPEPEHHLDVYDQRMLRRGSHSTDVYGSVLRHHGWQHHPELDQFGNHHWSHPSVDTNIRVHPDGEWSMHGGEGGLLAYGPNAGDLDTHLSQFHNSLTDQDEPVHNDYFSRAASRQATRNRQELHSVLQHHGWEATGGDLSSATHPSHPGHNISVDDTGNWSHSEGNVLHDSGNTPRQLDDHLESFHGTSTPAATHHVSSAHQALQHRGWQRTTSSDPDNFARWVHPDHPGVHVDTGNDTHALNRIFVVHRNNEPERTGHLSDISDTLDPHYPTSSQSLEPDFTSPHNALQRRGWQRTPSPDPDNNSRWIHPEHPGVELTLGDHNFSTHRHVMGNRHHERTGSPSELASTLDNWYPTSAPTGPRSR